MLLSEAIDALCIATRADGRSDATVKAYREKLGHLARFLNDGPVERITVDDLRAYIADQRARGLRRLLSTPVPGRYCGSSAG